MKKDGQSCVVEKAVLYVTWRIFYSWQFWKKGKIIAKKTQMQLIDQLLLAIFVDIGEILIKFR